MVFWRWQSGMTVQRMLDRDRNVSTPFSTGAQDLRRSEGLDSPKVQASRAALMSHRHRTGSAIFHQKDAAEFFYEVLSGSIFCSIMTSGGRRQILRFVGPRDIVGLTNEQNYGYSAEVMRCCTVKRYRTDQVQVALARDFELQRRLFDSMIRESDMLRNKMSLLGRRHSASKVAILLLEMEQVATTSCGRLSFPASRTEIADYLCISPETLCRKLGELRLSKLIEMPSAQEVLILHREGLERVAAKS